MKTTKILRNISELSYAVKHFKLCNVLVVNVLNNFHLNEIKLNREIKCITNLFRNCYFLETNYHKQLEHQIIHKINSIQYKNKFLTFGRRVASGAAGAVGSDQASKTKYYTLLFSEM